ncbi:MAG: YqhA family protein [Candidatus Obscuribacter sp.]|nr:YqhA family protein [Candidatus Obscuribacter sp.]
METFSIGLLLAAASVLVLAPLVWGALSELKQKRQPSAAEQLFSFPRLLLMCRWLLAPFYVGLVATVVLYMYKFMHKLLNLFLELPHLAEKEVMLKVLYLVDIVMVANLLMYTAIGSFAYFVSGFGFASDQEKPAMLGHLDATTLKIKLGMSLIGVSSIHLLEAFMDVEHIATDKMITLVAVHVVFVLSTMAIAWIRTLPTEPGGEHHR